MLKHLMLSLALLLMVSACAPAATTEDVSEAASETVAKESAEASTMSEADTLEADTPEASVPQAVTSNWKLTAYNPADDVTLTFLLQFQNTSGALGGTLHAFDPANPNSLSDPLGTVEGSVTSSERIDFRVLFADALGGGAWDVAARLNNSAFAGSYVTADGVRGTVTASNLGF